MNKVDISSEGAETLRAIAGMMNESSADIFEAGETLARRTESAKIGLGEQAEYYSEIIKQLISNGRTVCKLCFELALGLDKTASGIEGFLASSKNLENDIVALVNGGGGIEAELAFSGSAMADNLRAHATLEVIGSIRETASKSVYGARGRHPVNFGTWYDSDRNPIATSSFSNVGIYYWKPDPDHVFGNFKAGDIMKKYGFSEIKFVNGYPVFPPETILVEIRLPQPLSSCRGGSFRDADFIVHDKARLRECSLSVSPKFNQMVKEYMKKLGRDGDWFENRTQVSNFRKSTLSWNECEDMSTLQLMPQEVHAMVVHIGGSSNAKLRDGTANEFDLLCAESIKMLISRNEETNI